MFTLIFFFISCEKGSYQIINGELKHEDNIYYGEYEKFDGEIEYSLGEISEIYINYLIYTESGNLKFSILDSNKDVLVSVNGDEEELGEISKVLDEKEKIYLKIEEKNHKGNFLIEVFPED